MTKIYETTTIEAIFVGQGQEVKFIPYPIDYRRKVDYSPEYGRGQVVEFDRLTRYFQTDSESLQKQIEDHIMFKTNAITLRGGKQAKVWTKQDLESLGHPRLKSVVNAHTKHSPIQDMKPIQSWTVEELVSFILDNNVEVKE